MNRGVVEYLNGSMHRWGCVWLLVAAQTPPYVGGGAVSVNVAFAYVRMNEDYENAEMGATPSGVKWCGVMWCGVVWDIVV